MTTRALTILLGLTGLLFTTGCASRYQDLLRDRDAEIRELNGQVANLRAENDDLRRRERTAMDRANQLESQMANASVPASDDLSGLRSDLPDTEVRYRNNRVSIGIENTVVFDSGSVRLKPEAERVLRNVARVLQRDFSDRRIYIEGHTDTDPIQKTKNLYRDNRHLSTERADAVARFLVKNCSVPARMVAVVGYGPHDPIASGSTTGAKSRNRRVEIVIGDGI